MSRELSIVLHLTIDDELPEDERWEVDELVAEVLHNAKRWPVGLRDVRLVDYEVVRLLHEPHDEPRYSAGRDEESPAYRQHIRDAGRGGMIR